ncbi:MAG: endo-1,4-beta-xylanase [Geobacter sp.]|nr:endo-1,4-beta-xylanase [Geobacter sp.]
MMERRAVLKGLAGLVGFGAFASFFGCRHLGDSEMADDSGRDFSINGRATLRERAAAKGIVYGAACHQRTLFSDTEFAAVFAKECGILVPEGELKWGTLRPDPNSYNFAPADWLVEFAFKNKMLFRGHTLVWHGSMPKWFPDIVTSRNAEKFLCEHIATVVGRYAGRTHSWDVVNEAILPSDGQPGGLRKTPWLNLLGPGYIDIAFRAAKEADPKALLVYNDNGLDFDTPDNEAKRMAVLRTLEQLKSAGTPVHAFGIQAHLEGDRKPFNAVRLRNFLKDVASLDLKILITEMDVIDQKLPADRAVRDRVVAGLYEDYLAAVLDEPAVIAVLTWGLSDKYSWLAKYRSRDDKAPVRPLPLDEKFQRKLSWNAMARIFDMAPRR